MPTLRTSKPIPVLIYLLLASGAFALDLTPGIYAISAVSADPPTCLGHYIAYDTKTSRPDVYLILSDTSQPPLWRVDAGLNGTFLLTAVNRTNKARAVLTYDPLSCSDTKASLGFNGKASWKNAGGVLIAARRECPLSGAVALAPLKTAGSGSCRSVGLVSSTSEPKSATTWHFKRYPGAPLEIFTTGYNRPFEGLEEWAASVAMDDDLLVEGTRSQNVFQPTYWQRRAGGVWRRGNLTLPAGDFCTPSSGCLDSQNVAMGASFVALSVPLPESSSAGTMPYWKVHVYDKARLNKLPVATLTAADALPSGIVIAAGGDNIVVSNFRTKTFVFSRNKAGKWSTPVLLDTPKAATTMQMSHDGRALAMSVFGEENSDAEYIPLSNGKVLVFRQTKAGGTWVQEADIQPPKAFGTLVFNPAMALVGDDLAVSFSSNIKNLFFYRRSKSGAWKLVQSMTPPRQIARMVGDGDTVVAVFNGRTNQAIVYKRNKATGKWVEGRTRQLPRWNDDFAQSSKANRNYGEMALSGKRLAITAAFNNEGRSSPGVTFIYDNIDKW